MSNDPVGRRPRTTDHQSTLRLVALAAVSLGVVLLAAAAFVLSYEGIHHIALRAGVSAELAKLYPLIFDVMLVVAAAAALALRGAGWWARCYAWGSLLVVLAALAAGNAVYATGTTLPVQRTKGVLAVIPWVLLLAAFGLLLAMLRHFRAVRSTAAKATAPAASGAAASGAVAGADINGGQRTAAAASGGKVRELPRVDLETLLGPRAGEPPAIEVLYSIGTGQNAGHQVDPVSYGETGYVHPDSYLDEGEYSPHGDTGGPESPAVQAGDGSEGGTHLARNGTATVEAPGTQAEAPAPAAETPAGPVQAPATSAEAPATSAHAAATAAETPAGPAQAPATSAETSAVSAETPAGPAETPATSAETPATSAETPAASAEAPDIPAQAPATSAEPPGTAAEPTASTETPARPAQAAATSAEPPGTAAEPTASAEAPAAAAVATATPAEAPAAEAAPGAKNGLVAGGDGAAAETPTGQEGAAEAGLDGAGLTREAAGTDGPALERIRSTPTRPED
jgi:hypothetical protein